MKKTRLWLCNIFVKVLDKQVCNIRLYEVVIKLIIICFENNIKCSLNVNKRITVLDSVVSRHTISTSISTS